MSNIPEYSVTELSVSIKRNLEQEYSRIRVKGEISGLKNWNGHLLFNLKDEKSLLAARIWQNTVSFLSINPEEGLEIIALGKLSTHMQRSNYNFIIENIELASEGSLLKLIEDRKKKFQSLGYFKNEIKKSLPTLPNKIGIITSLTGSVIEDMKRRIKERYPSHLLLWPVAVQGLKAEKDISQAIKGFNNIKDKPDVIILARGGGSIEDLMPFNSESVVSEIHKSHIPIISAIGHETDYSISDLVADKRASTPTAAADIVVPEKKQLFISLKSNQEYLDKGLINLIEKKAYKLNAISAGVIEPSMFVKMLHSTYSDLFININNRLKNLLITNKNIINKIYLRKPINKLKTSKEKYFNIKNLLNENLEKTLKTKKQLFDNEVKILESCSYERLLEKGFTIIRNSKNEVIKSISKVKVKNTVKIFFKDGETVAYIKKISKKSYRS